MIITLIAHEKNLGLLTLTDFLLEKLGKNNSSVVGSNYLVQDNDPILKKIKDFQDNNKNVLIKYVVPKTRFSNQYISYPDCFKEISDVVLRVPRFVEEVKKPVNLEVYKGEDNPILKRVKEFYK